MKTYESDLRKREGERETEGDVPLFLKIQGGQHLCDKYLIRFRGLFPFFLCLSTFV